jgi:hypothetical protein
MVQKKWDAFLLHKSMLQINTMILYDQARHHDFMIGAANLVGFSQNLGGYGGMLPRKIFYSRMLSGAFSRIFGTVYSLSLVHVIIICQCFFTDLSAS